LALRMGNRLCVLSQNGTFPPFRIWAARFPFCHHRSTMTPSIHWTVLLPGPERNHERLHHHLAPPLIQPEGCGCHVSRPPVEDWLATSSDQRQQAGHAHGGGVQFTMQGGPSIHRLVHTNILAQAWPGLGRPGFRSRTLTSSQTPLAISLSS